LTRPASRANKPDGRVDDVIPRLNTIDLPRRLEGVAPRWLVWACLGVACGLAATAARLGLGILAPGAVPFALLFPAMLLATVAAGWQAGAVSALVGGVASWRLFVAPLRHFSIDRPDGVVTLLLYVGSAVLIIAFTGAYRGIALAQAAAGDEAAAERDRLRAEQRLRDSESRLRLALEAGRMAVWQVDSERGVVLASPELNRLLGRPDTPSFPLAEMGARGVPGEADRVRTVALAARERGERYFESEYRHRLPNGQLRWMLLRAELLIGPKGESRGALGVIMDVTDRRDDEERLRLLAREVDHRANNLLAVVQGTVKLSQAADAAQLKDVIVGRVSALARAHQLLSAARWQGADLRRLVEEELLAFSLGKVSPVNIQGPDVALGPAAAQGLAMALHELATNAAKYGALSVPQGSVAVAWRIEAGGGLMIRWLEQGGPQVAQPTRRGLGMTLLERALDGSLGGSVRQDWRPDGLACELALPASALHGEAAATSP
jgi:PAS domain S-box-containing protein